MLKNKIRIAAILVSLTLSGFASAQAYIGSSVGQAKWNSDCTGNLNCDTSGNSYKFFGGYNLENNFAVEASYFSLGNISASFNKNGVSASNNIKGKGFELAGLYKYDFSNEFSAFAKLGLASIKTESNINLLNVMSEKTSTTSTQPVFGIGLSYKLNKDFSVRAEFEDRQVKVSNDKAHVHNFTVGVQYAF